MPLPPQAFSISSWLLRGGLQGGAMLKLRIASQSKPLAPPLADSRNQAWLVRLFTPPFLIGRRFAGLGCKSETTRSLQEPVMLSGKHTASMPSFTFA